jgi:hypothetical protein
MTRDLPHDLHAFRAKDPDFPRHSTVDQLFTDQKFDAYRVLGRNAARAAFKAMEECDRPPMATVDRSDRIRRRWLAAIGLFGRRHERQ